MKPPIRINISAAEDEKKGVESHLGSRSCIDNSITGKLPCLATIRRGNIERTIIVPPVQFDLSYHPHRAPRPGASIMKGDPWIAMKNERWVSEINFTHE